MHCQMLAGLRFVAFAMLMLPKIALLLVTEMSPQHALSTDYGFFGNCFALFFKPARYGANRLNERRQGVCKVVWLNLVENELPSFLARD